MNIGNEIGNTLTGMAAFYVAGNVCYWIGRLVVGLSIGEWQIKDEDATDWCACMGIGLCFAFISTLVGALCALLGHAILQAVGA
jgi:hypothetical protein